VEWTKRAIVIVVLLATTAPIFAAGTITDVMGVFSATETLVLDGSGFGIKSSAKPLIWADFESSINPTS